MEIIVKRHACSLCAKEFRSPNTTGLLAPIMARVRPAMSQQLQQISAIGVFSALTAYFPWQIRLHKLHCVPAVHTRSCLLDLAVHGFDTKLVALKADTLLFVMTCLATPEHKTVG
jgi:hypothetical protein